MDNPYSSPDTDGSSGVLLNRETTGGHSLTWLGLSLMFISLALPCVGYTNANSGIGCVFVMGSYFLHYLFSEKYVFDELAILIGVFLASILFAFAAVLFHNENQNRRSNIFAVSAIACSIAAFWLATELNVGFWVYEAGLASIFLGTIDGSKKKDFSEYLFRTEPEPRR